MNGCAAQQQLPGLRYVFHLHIFIHTNICTNSHCMRLQTIRQEYLWSPCYALLCAAVLRSTLRCSALLSCVAASERRKLIFCTLLVWFSKGFHSFEKVKPKKKNAVTHAFALFATPMLTYILLIPLCLCVCLCVYSVQFN